MEDFPSFTTHDSSQCWLHAENPFTPPDFCFNIKKMPDVENLR